MLTNKKSEDAWSSVFWLAKYLKQMSPTVGPENKTSQELRKLLHKLAMTIKFVRKLEVV